MKTIRKENHQEQEKEIIRKENQEGKSRNKKSPEQKTPGTKNHQEQKNHQNKKFTKTRKSLKQKKNSTTLNQYQKEKHIQVDDSF